MEKQSVISPAESGHIVCETDLIVFRHSTIHGTGGYARKQIAAGTQVIEYVGEKITKAVSVKRCEASNAYIFTLDNEFDLDGDVAWNPARFINHSCAPNCEAEIDDDQHIWIVALRDIQPGEELTFNYNYDLVEYREHPCQCGTPECVGFIVAEEFFDHVRKQNPLAHS
jgi:SET domain-containing protein